MHISQVCLSRDAGTCILSLGILRRSMMLICGKRLCHREIDSVIFIGNQDFVIDSDVSASEKIQEY
jgi:hypothetical protein